MAKEYCPHCLRISDKKRGTSRSTFSTSQRFDCSCGKSYSVTIKKRKSIFHKKIKDTENIIATFVLVGYSGSSFKTVARVLNKDQRTIGNWCRLLFKKQGVKGSLPEFDIDAVNEITRLANQLEAIASKSRQLTQPVYNPDICHSLAVILLHITKDPKALQGWESPRGKLRVRGQLFAENLDYYANPDGGASRKNIYRKYHKAIAASVEYLGALHRTLTPYWQLAAQEALPEAVRQRYSGRKAYLEYRNTIKREKELREKIFQQRKQIEQKVLAEKVVDERIWTASVKQIERLFWWISSLEMRGKVIDYEYVVKQLEHHCQIINTSLITQTEWDMALKKILAYEDPFWKYKCGSLLYFGMKKSTLDMGLLRAEIKTSLIKILMSETLHPKTLQKGLKLIEIWFGNFDKAYEMAEGLRAESIRQKERLGISSSTLTIEGEGVKD